jgi:polysaccharide deacetylase 2 family uncharacterized protein YibQ
MTSTDSPGEKPKPKPGSFLFWAGASAFAAVVALGLFFFMRASGEPQEPSFVVRLGPATETGPGAAEAPAPDASASGATEPANPASGPAALIAPDGTVVVDPALLQTGADGPLPVISPDGRKPMDVYAAKYDFNDPRPRVAIVLTGLGLSDAVTQDALDKLPRGITLAMTPYGEGLQNWTASARAKGFEVALEVPMEPFVYPDDDPGPNTLLTGSGAADNPQRLSWLLSRFSGYAGVINVQGGKFLASPPELKPFLSQVSARGLYMADASLSQRSVAEQTAKETGATFVRADIQLDKTPSADAFDMALEALANAALERRSAVGVAAASHGAIERLSTWARGLEAKGVALAPLSAALPAGDAGEVAPPP